MPAGGGDVSVCARSPFPGAQAAPGTRQCPPSGSPSVVLPHVCGLQAASAPASPAGDLCSGRSLSRTLAARPVCRARRSLLPGREPGLGPGSAPSLNSGWPCAFLPHRPVLLPQLSRHKTPAGGICLLTANKVCQYRASRAPSPVLLNKRGEGRSGGGFLFG